MKNDAQRVFINEPIGATVADQVRLTRQRLHDVVTRGRELRSISAAASADQAASTLVRAVAAVVDRLPRTGAVAFTWDEALSFVQLERSSTERLRELQDELRKANVLCAFGSHVVAFARDAG